MGWEGVVAKFWSVGKDPLILEASFLLGYCALRSPSAPGEVRMYNQCGFLGWGYCGEDWMHVGEELQ